MKVFLFLVALANVGLFMWEYKQGAFEPSVEVAEQYDSPDQERILLASELKNAQQAQASGPEPDNSAGLEKTPATAAPSVSLKGLEASDNNLLAEQLSPPMDKLAAEAGLSAENSADRPIEQKKAEKALPESAHSDKAKSDQSGLESKPVQPIIAAVEKAQDSDAASEPIICYEAGPFANGNAYQLWKRELNAPKEAIKSLSRDGEVISDYLVYYPAAETKQQVEANLKMIKDKGINDLWLLTKGKDNGLISLGVFKNESRALAMKSQMLAKGIQAEVKPRYTPKPQKYAQIKAGGKVQERLNVMKQTYPAVVVKQINQCW
ncbi:hypothetical protein [Methylobacter sp. YRD-M1]|uniref:hypothetical protein n=1 Tax=Methylobacter sp. YRD-M1 TaxID=2911520 RepID=UPI00227C10C2|nr:hypothetical protein [Methylobacter sp. YRD-M1]WAK00420.1 hypothetical protein LZ558_11185 [Methylobacter sp. YRD-M1]